VTIQVRDVAFDPAAADDTATTPEDTPVDITVLGNDSDPDGDPLSVTAVSDPANGAAVINGDGTVTYTPDPDFNGVDTFTYTISDGNGGSDTATVTVTVTPVNDPPVAVDDTATTVEDTPVDVVVLANDSDPEGDPLTVTGIVTTPANGTAVINGDNTITYTPDPNFSGVDAFQYEISDGNGGTDTAWVSFILVTPINDDPVAVDDPATTPEDTPVTVPVLTNDTDLDGDTLTVQSVTQPANGTVVDNGDGTVTYTPDPDFSGTDTFTYTITDGNGGTDTATVTVTVTPSGTNNDPAAADDAATTDEDTPVVISPLDNDTDADGDTLTMQSVTQPANGTVVINGDGTVTYTPDPNYNGTDTFTYTITDGNGGTSTATVTVTVTTGVSNNPPDFSDDPANTSQTVTVGGSLTRLTASDPDGDPYTFSLAAGSLPPGVSLNPDGTFSGSPTSTGSFSATITVCDGFGLCSNGVLSVQVVAQGQLPRTGVDSNSLALLGTLMALLGGILVGASRRRREQGI
jgi:LPXTG-motif cell wall-anchored protein